MTKTVYTVARNEREAGRLTLICDELWEARETALMMGSDSHVFAVEIEVKSVRVQ